MPQIIYSWTIQVEATFCFISERFSVSRSKEDIPVVEAGRRRLEVTVSTPKPYILGTTAQTFDDSPPQCMADALNEDNPAKPAVEEVEALIGNARQDGQNGFS